MVSQKFARRVRISSSDIRMGGVPKPEELRVTFEIQGPILRQIIDDGPRPPRDVAIEHISLWLTATQLQLGRFRRSLRSDIELLFSQGRTRQYASQRVHIDEHLLLAAAANLGKALDRFGGDLPALELPSGLPDLLRHLRNVYEHWEDYKPHVANPPRDDRSGKKLKELNPDAQDDIRSEYPPELIRSGERGKYTERYREETNIVLIDPAERCR